MSFQTPLVLRGPSPEGLSSPAREVDDFDFCWQALCHMSHAAWPDLHELRGCVPSSEFLLSHPHLILVFPPRERLERTNSFFPIPLSHLLSAEEAPHALKATPVLKHQLKLHQSLFL